MKKLFTKLCLLTIAMVMGVSSAWAETGDVTTNADINFSSGIVEGVVTGTKNSMTIGTPSGSGAAAYIDVDGWFRQGDVTNVVTIPEAERAGARDVVTVSLKMAWGNKNGMGSSFKLKDAEGAEICSFSYCRWGSNSNTLNINMSGLVGSQYQNKPIVARYTLFEVTIDYAAKTISTKVSCQNPVASQTFVASLTNTNPVASFETAGFNVGGNTDRADAFKDLVIKTIEGDYDVATADYIVKYVDGSDNEIKESSAARTGDVNSNPILLGTDKEAIYVNGKKYTYASDDASSVTIASDNSTVVTVRFNEVPKYNYVIKAQDSNSNDIKTLAEGATFTDENVTMYIPLQLLKNGKLYGISGENSWKSYTITSDNQVETITYPNVLENVVAFVEGEDAAGASVSTPTGNQQLASGGHMGRGANLPIGTITMPGKYQVTFHYINTNGSAHPVTINSNGVALQEVSADASSRKNYSTSEFTIIESSDITFSLGGSSTSGVDYIYIVKTGDYVLNATLNAEGFATFSAACPMQITGAKAYKGAIDGDYLILTEIADGKVPAGVGVILIGEAEATATATAIAEAPAVEGNALRATTLADGTLATLESCLALSGKELVKYTGDAFVANKAYLPYDFGGSAKGLTIVFDDEEATAINGVAEAAPVAVKKFFKNGKFLIQTAKGTVNAVGIQVK